ncbi:hypothetical protein ACFVVM_21975 [Nocardia sp. NPDC058176]|uniref:DUF7373 family lipoprotein n=1 Tax=Nocardia sp. NPDC058176 TaxID=3346368 RepID=UPI0036D80F60
MRWRSRCFAALLVGTTLVAAGCGAQAPVFDHGDYALEPAAADYDAEPSRVRGATAESIRIGERLLFVDSVDPDLTKGNGGGVVVGLNGVDDLLSGVQRSALLPFDVLAGFGVIGSNGRADDDPGQKLISITLLSLPDEEQAVAAGAAMAAADFAANTENAPLALPEHPAALTHWRPGVRTVGSWLVWKTLVIRVFAVVAEPDPAVMIDLLTRTYRGQLNELDTFVPTPAAELANLALDRDELLPRLVKTGDYWPHRWSFAVYGPRAYALLSGQPSVRLRDLEASAISAVAVTRTSFLFRAPDEDAVRTYAEALTNRLLDRDYSALASTPDLPGVSCHRAARPDPSSTTAHQFACVVRHGEFVVLLHSNREMDVRRQAVAQYALLGGSW